MGLASGKWGNRHDTKSTRNKKTKTKTKTQQNKTKRKTQKNNEKPFLSQGSLWAPALLLLVASYSFLRTWCFQGLWDLGCHSLGTLTATPPPHLQWFSVVCSTVIKCFLLMLVVP